MNRPPTRLATRIALVLLITLAAGAFAIPSADTAPALYSFVDADAPAAITATSAQRIAVDAAPLVRGAETLALPRPGGNAVLARLESLERRGPGDVTWRGMVDGGGRITLTAQGGFVAGRAEMPDGAYEIATSPAGTMLIALAAVDFPECANVLPGAGDRSASFTPSPVVPGRGLLPVDPPDQIDVMIFYTPQARDGAGGVAQIAATAQAAVDAANGAYADSDMIQRLRLVHTELANYNDSGSVFNDRQWVSTDPVVATRRDEKRADLVALLTENGGGFCGVAFLMGAGDSPALYGPFGFQVTARSCAVGNFTYAHEHGHNLGFQHNPPNGAPPAQALFLHAYGHDVNGVARTVMSTQGGCCPRVGHFSNPDVDFMPPTAAGNPSGIADARDNARVGDFVAPFAANWRVGLGIFASGFEEGNTSAWSQTVP